MKSLELIHEWTIEQGLKAFYYPHKSGTFVAAPGGSVKDKIVIKRGSKLLNIYAGRARKGWTQPVEDPHIISIYGLAITPDTKFYPAKLDIREPDFFAKLEEVLRKE